MTYAYAANNPLRYVDPNGLGIIDSSVAGFMGLTGLLWPGAQVSLRWAPEADFLGIPQLAMVVENHPLQPANYATTYPPVICSPGKLNPQTWKHEQQHLVQAHVLAPFDLYIVGHIAAQAWSYITTGNYSQANPLEAGPYSNPPRPWW